MPGVDAKNDLRNFLLSYGLFDLVNSRRGYGVLNSKNAVKKGNGEFSGRVCTKQQRNAECHKTKCKQKRGSN